MVVNGAFIEYINTIPDCAVYALIDENTKKVYINHSTKFKEKLGNLHGVCKVEYFPISAHPVYKLIEAERVRLMYINKGYEISNQKTPFIRFTPYMKIDSDSRHMLVYILSSRRERFVMGVFSSVTEAEDFHCKYYKDWDGVPVFAETEATRKYFANPIYKQKLMPGDLLNVESSAATQTGKELE